MNCKLLFVLVLISLLTVDYGDAFWGRRRRRGKGSWFRRAVSAVGRFWKKHKHWIKPGLAALGFGDFRKLEQLMTLKDKDRESYNEFMQKLRTSLEEEYSASDVDELIDALNHMQLDDLEEMRYEWFDKAKADNTHNDELAKDLSSRIAALQ